MGRRKIEIKPIKDDRNRSVTFLKRKGGLFKKAHELSVLCQVDVAVIIFGQNKKLYQYCSGDIMEMVNRHSFYDTAHETKGPLDFKDKNSQDDDDDDDLPERAGSHSSNDHPMHPQLQNPAFHPIQNRHTASASPPTMNKSLNPSQYGMGPRVGTPQPMNRPASRGSMQRRTSSGLMPPNGYPASQPPPQNAGMYSYHMPHPSAYNAGPQMPMQPSQIPYQSYPAHHSQQPPPPQQPAPQHPAPSQSQTEFLPDPRRSSMPATYTPEPVSEPEHAIKIEAPAIVQGIEKRAPAKSRSTFTPIGPSESMLAQHFATFGSDPGPRPRPVDVGIMKRDTQVKTERPAPPPPPQPIDTGTSVPSRSNSINDPKSAGMRPKLKVQIPIEAEDAQNRTESPRESSAAPGNLSARPGNENGPVVLPPPSPAGLNSALLSAGATGPSNPFSRPLPVSSVPEQTPMSALPSRFAQGIIPSPSAFFGDDWDVFNKGGMLPSPLNFQTPTVANGNGPSFFRQEPSESTTNGNNGVNVNGKRVSPEAEGADSKRQKT